MGISEQTLSEVRMLSDKVDTLMAMMTSSTGTQGAFLKVSALARKYGRSRSFIEDKIQEVKAAGFDVELPKKKGAHRSINAALFHEGLVKLGLLGEGA